MLPTEYRNRYIAFFALSMLVHLAVVVYFMWNPVFEIPEKETKTVEIKLKQTVKQEEKKSAKKRDWEEVKKKREQERIKEAKKKKADKPKKEKKKEPKKEQPKKEKPKKKEEKKVEKKQEVDPLAQKFSVDKKPKPQKNKSSEAPSKEQQKPAKSQKSKTQEAAKKIAPKAPVKKVQPAKPTADKAETKPAKPKAQGPKPPKQDQAKQAQDKAEAAKLAKSKSAKPPGPKPKEKVLDIGMPKDWAMKFGSMTLLDDTQMQRTIVATNSVGRRYQQRSIAGKRAVKQLTPREKEERESYLSQAVDVITKHLIAPKKDGNKYYGEILIHLDKEGYIEELTFKTPSGHAGLDNAFYQAVVKTMKIEMPPDPKVAFAIYANPIKLWYDENDMAD